MQAVEVNQNWTLVNDHIRGWRARAVIISDDAKGCFDRITHVVAILALRRLGIPRPAIMSMIITIQRMQHYIRTAFGESEQSQGPNPSDPPPQGLGLVNLLQCGWAFCPSHFAPTVKWGPARNAKLNKH